MTEEHTCSSSPKYADNGKCITCGGYKDCCCDCPELFTEEEIVQRAKDQLRAIVQTKQSQARALLALQTYPAIRGHHGAYHAKGECTSCFHSYPVIISADNVKLRNFTMHTCEFCGEKTLSVLSYYDSSINDWINPFCS
jgi:hypothetical protein